MGQKPARKTEPTPTVEPNPDPTAIPAIDRAAFVAEELIALTSLVGELLAAWPGQTLIDPTSGMPTGLGIAVASLVASYSADVQAAFWLRSQARVLGLFVGTRRWVMEAVYGCL